MKRWWASHPEMLKTRRRLRNGYRGSLKQAIQRERKKMEHEYQLKVFDLRMRQNEIEAEYRRWAESVSSIRCVVRDYQLDKEFCACVRLNYHQLVQARDVNTLVMVLADDIGKQVSHGIFDLFVNRGNPK